MKLIVDKVSSLTPLFKESVLYNEEVLAEALKVDNVYLFSLLDGDKVVAQVPTIKNGIGEYEFAGYYYCPYVDIKWFTNGVGLFTDLIDKAKDENKIIDIVDILATDETKELKDDIGSSLVKVNDRADRRSNYSSRSMRKHINRMRNKTKGKLRYVPIEFKEGNQLLKYWFNLYDNKYFENIKKIYAIWYAQDRLLANGIMYNDMLVGVDYILLDEGIAHGVLTPWDRDIEELYRLEIGHYAIDRALDLLYCGGMKKFNLGERSVAYKQKWETSILETKIVGLGRWENRE